MKFCKTCKKELSKYQKSTCSHKCRNEYVRRLNKGRPSPFKGSQNRWTEDQKKKIGDSQRGVPKSEEFKEKCRLRLLGKPSFHKGHKHTKKWVEEMRKRLHGEKHWNWKGGIVEKEGGQNQYNISLRRKKNGFSKELFDSLMNEQKGLCAICNIKLERGLKSSTACADHCHFKKQTRGILCKRCNLMLGYARDDIQILLNAIQYLSKWNCCNSKRTA